MDTIAYSFLVIFWVVAMYHSMSFVQLLHPLYSHEWYEMDILHFDFLAVVRMKHTREMEWVCLHMIHSIHISFLNRDRLVCKV